MTQDMKCVVQPVKSYQIYVTLLSKLLCKLAEQIDKKQKFSFHFYYRGDLSTQLVLPEILKLAVDESLLVKISCFQCLIDVLPLFEDGNFRYKIFII